MDLAPSQPPAVVTPSDRAPSVQVDRDGDAATTSAPTEDGSDLEVRKWPTPRSLDIPPPEQVAERTEGWKKGELLGLRLFFPPEWEILESWDRSRQEVDRYYQPIGRWEEYDQFGMTRTRRNDFVTLFA